MPNREKVIKNLQSVANICAVNGDIQSMRTIDDALSLLNADVVPVIRCRDCRHSMMTYDGECKYCSQWIQEGIDEALYLDGDFYCAFAEKKEVRNGS